MAPEGTHMEGKFFGFPKDLFTQLQNTKLLSSVRQFCTKSEGYSPTNSTEIDIYIGCNSMQMKGDQIPLQWAAQPPCEARFAPLVSGFHQHDYTSTSFSPSWQANIKAVHPE